MRPDVFRLRPWQRHSLVLAVGGAVYLALGIVYLTNPLTPDRAQGLRLGLNMAGGSIAPWGMAWCTVGLLALVSTRWPPASKTWGYTALSALPAAWGSIYLYGVIVYDTPHSNIASVVVWFLLAFLWWAISGLMNPDDVPIADVSDPPGD